MLGPDQETIFPGYRLEPSQLRLVPRKVDPDAMLQIKMQNPAADCNSAIIL
jgi:hypothetical protein